MTNQRLKTLFNPDNLKILALLRSKTLTAAEILKAIPSLKQATVYRSLGFLEKNGYITISEEVPVRGTVLKKYTATAEGIYKLGDLESMTKEEHLSMYTLFMASTIAEMSSYLDGDYSSYKTDGITYGKFGLNLNDADTALLIEDIKKVLTKYAKKSNPSQRLRQITCVCIPERKE